MVYIVMFRGEVIGLFTSPVDACEVSKRLNDATVITCRLNDYSDEGERILQNPA